MAVLEQAQGNTWYLKTMGSCIPLFFLNKRDVILLDSGLPGKSLEYLMECLRKNQLTVRAVLTSHAHIDHVGGHSAFSSKGAEIYASLYNAAVLQNPLGLKSYFYEDSYEELLEHGRNMFCTVHTLILPGQKEVCIDGAKFTVLDLPGHSPEHLGFVTPDGVAYIADLLMSEEILSKAKLPYTMCCEKDLQSKRIASQWTHPCYLLAHNGCYTEIRSLVQCNTALFEERLTLTQSLLRQGKTMEDCTAAVLEHLNLNCQNSLIWMSAERTVRAWVQCLVSRGTVEKRLTGTSAIYRQISK